MIAHAEATDTERPFRALLQLARALVDTPADGRSAEVLAAGILDLRCTADLVELVCSRWLRGFEQVGGPEAAGATSTVAWAQSECRLSGQAAADRVEVGRHLDVLPRVAAAVESGEIGFEHAAVLARTARDVGPQVMRAAEEDLLDEARRIDPGRLRGVARSFRHAVDSAAFLANAIKQHDRRRLRLIDYTDGMTAVDGLLDPESAAVVRTALDPFMMPTAGDDRSTEQRRADAFVTLARQSLRGGSAGSAGRRRPQVIVLVREATLRGEAGAPAADMGRGAMVPAESARRIACDCVLTTVTVNAAGQATEPGRSRRTFTPGEWAAMATRDRGCRWPGCGAPLDWCEGHHLDSWVFTRRTSIGTSALLCDKHHRKVHEGGWTLTGDPGKELVAVPPRRDGSPGLPASAGVLGARVWRERAGRRSRRAAPVEVRAGPAALLA